MIQTSVRPAASSSLNRPRPGAPSAPGYQLLMERIPLSASG
jgi:hypothetical protein